MGGKVLKPILVKRRYLVKEPLKLILYGQNIVMRDKLIEHHDKTWISAGHGVKRSDLRR